MAALIFIGALIAAGTMGFAIQRGATCTVAAVDEIVQRRKISRLSAMLEAAVWVAVGLGLAEHFHMLTALPGGFDTTFWTISGAALLGLGAYINGACVFGGIARLGSGQWGYVFMPLGYFLGCLAMPLIFTMPVVIPRESTATMSLAASLALWPLGLLLLWRFGRLIMELRTQATRAVWSPRLATIVIGITFLATLLLSGRWAYTEVLADLAHGMAEGSWQRILMALALFGGAMVGGLTTGRFRWTSPGLTGVIRCLLGGAMMACGSLLIPGSNDGLILIGMPLLWPYAWSGFLTMCISIAIAQLVGRYMSRGQPA
ncbi:hypothetical protein AAKU67_001210 [Oxalobacteraceae bacterium GrIS 2.11]